jgi:outer membrane receptor protein involved in Fe transport
MRNMYRTAIVLAVIVVFLALSVLPGRAQTSNGVIAGVIVDKSGAGVPSATVEATSSDRGGQPRVSETDSAGSYRIESLMPGTYTLVVKKGGFAELKVSGLEVNASLTTTFNGTLEVAGQVASILVEASTGQELQTQSGDLSASISSAEIHDLPIFGLNPIALVLTQAGVQDPGDRGISNGVNFSVNGTRPRANNFLIDGQDNNDNAINGQAFQPSNLEAIGEVTLLTNSYGAEFGRGGGSVTNVIYKGGTNNFHGSAWDLANNSALATAKHEDLISGCELDTPPTCHPVFVENVFGFSIGGPIKHDKLFVFGSSQWDRFRSTNNGSSLTAPTTSGVAQLQALNSANANFLIAAFAGLTASTVAKSVPIGTATPTGTDRGSIDFGLVRRSGIGEKSNDRQWDVRVDFTASDRDSIMARYYRDDGSLTPDLFNFPRQLEPFDSQQGGPSQSFAGGWTHTFSPKAINELRVSYTNIGFSFGPTGATASNPLAQMPTVSIAGISSGSNPFPTLGFPSNLPQGRAHKAYQYQDALSYTVGRHTLKGGVDVNHLSVVDAIPFNSRGTTTYFGGAVTDADNCGLLPSTFNPNGGCPGLANFIDNFSGPAGAISKVFGSPILQPFVTTYAPYVQDTWRVKENFTLTLGLRYEYWGSPENVLQFPAINPAVGIGGLAGVSFPAVYSSKQPADRNNFGPRVGIAYTPHGWSRLFGQNKTVIRAGYGMFYDGLFTNILDNTGGTPPNAVGGTLTGTSAQNGGRGLANATGLLNAVAPILNPLATVNTIAGNLMNPMTQQWNLDIQREFRGGFIFTAAYVGTRGEHLFVNQQYNPGVINPVTNAGVRINPALGGVTVRTNGGDSIYHAAQFTVDRKFSRGLLLRGAYTFSKLLDDASEVFTISQASSFSADPFNQKRDRGPSLYDRRQRFVLTYIWDVPYVHSTENAGYRILNALTSHFQWSGFATFQTGQPETIIVGSDRQRDLNGTNDRPNLVDASLPQGDFNRYAAAAIGTIGNLGRNTYVGPNSQYWDMAIQKTIPIGFHHMEHQALTLRAEFFNTLNHANRFLPDLNLADGASTTPGDGGFGDTTVTAAGYRQIKIYIRYSF